MKLKIITSSVLLLVSSLHAVPVTIVSPLDINKSSAGYSIANPGTYLLSDDVRIVGAAALSDAAIIITTSHVVLDLNNKSMFGSAGAAIRVSGFGNITIRNGKIFDCSDSGITVTNGTNVTLENINSSSNSSMGISLAGSAQCFIRNCVTEANTFTGISLIGSNDVQVFNCTSEKNRSGITVSGENIRITAGQYNRNSSSGITVVTSTQVVIEQLQANDNNGNAGIALLSGADFFVNNCLAQKNTNTGIALLSTVGFSVVYSSKALHNGVDGFSNNSGTSALFGNIAFGNVTNNYGGTGPVAAIQVQNGGQMNPGSVVDPQIDNISIS